MNYACAPSRKRLAVLLAALSLFGVERALAEMRELPVFLLPTQAFDIRIDPPVRDGALSQSDLLVQLMDSRENPDTPVSDWLDLGLKLAVRGEMEKAVYCLNIVREQDESLLPPDGWTILALYDEEQGAWDNALRGWYRLAEAAPQNATAWMRAGLCHLRLGDFDRAYRLFAQLHHRQPRESLNLHMMGVTRYLMGEGSRAWREFARAAVTGTPYSETHLMLAYLSTQSGDVEEAIGWLRLALDGLPREQRARYARLPHFEALRGQPHYMALLEDFQIAAPDARSEHEADHELEWPASRRAEPGSQPLEELWVDIRLRPTDEPEADPPATGPGLAEFRGLQLRMTHEKSDYQEIAPIDDLD